LKDFKPDNVLVTSTGKVTIVDMDSIQICENGRLLFPGTAATDTYIPPEFYKGVGQNKNDILDKSWDNFAVSVVFYQLLFGLHPYVVVPYVDSEESNTIPYCIKENLFPFGINSSKIKSFAKPHNNFNVVPPQVQQLFVRAFGLNPSDRPQAMEWGKTIKQVIDNAGESTELTPPPIPTDIVYKLTTASSGNGSISLSAKTEKEGKTIYIYDSPDKGYELSELFWSTPKGEYSLGIKHTFVMPNSDVKVRAVFVKKESYGKGWKVLLSVISWAAAIIVLVTMLSNC
jgi:serine/threonine protein kinase